MAIDTSCIRQERAQFSMGAKRERGKGYLFPNGIYYAREVANNQRLVGPVQLEIINLSERRRGNTDLFRFSQQLPRICLGPLKGCLSCNSALPGPSFYPMLCFPNYTDEWTIYITISEGSMSEYLRGSYVGLSPT